ncbi:MAG TPA: DUF6169 family protein [Hymenobacter sp.]
MKSGEYRFTTAKYQEYIAYFIEAEGYFGDSELGKYASMFGFFPADGYKPFEFTYDPRISDTIAQIVKDFFLDITRIAVYVCNTSDQRQQARHILFQMWLRYYNDGSIICAVICKSSSTYACLLYHRNNPFKEQIEQEIPEFIKKIEPYT